jgi:hypothetical protein
MKSPLLPGGPRRSLLVSEPTHSSFSATTGKQLSVVVACRSPSNLLPVKIIKCFIGAASFELPGAIKNGGLHASLAGILALAAVSYYTLRMLARCGELLNTRSATYPEIGRAAAGRPGYAAAWLGIVFMTLGVCSAYYTFVANMLADLFQDSHPFFTRVHSVLLLLPAFVQQSWGPYVPAKRASKSERPTKKALSGRSGLQGARGGCLRERASGEVVGGRPSHAAPRARSGWGGHP